MRKTKLEKICCEICGNDNKAVLHNHHLIERTELNTNNHNTNLICICSNCHNEIHHGKLKVIGLFDSTKLPYGRSVIYVKDGICNVPELKNEQSYYKLENESMKLP